MKVRSHILSPSVARAIAAVCATVFVTSAHMGWAGINVWTSHGPGSVGITALAVDPTTPNTLYAGTQDGAVFKSTDSAGSWGNAGLPGPSYVRALAIDPTTPGTLYAGTYGGVFSIEQVAGTRVVGTGTAGSCTDAALNAALAGGGLVTFDCGPALVTIDISTGTGTKTIAADTSIDGGGVITISGGHRVPTIFSVNPGVNLTLKNLTIAQNLGFGECGDGLPCHKSAAVANSFGTLTVINSTFTDDGDFGIANFATLSVTNSTFIGTSGEGIANGGTLTVANSTFTANGGGISNYVAGAPAIITNSTFTGNSGAGISNYGTLTVTNSTFTGNSLGISNDGATNGSTVLLRNTIVSNSVSDDDCTGSITDGGHNLADDTSCGFSAANGSLSNTDPQLDPAGLRDNGGPTQTVALCTAVGVPAGCTAASPAIDAGDQAACAAAPVNNLDQRGFVRPGTGHTQCSIGAYEAGATAVGACTGDCDGGGSATVDEVITLVDIALGTTQLSACPHGVPSGLGVDIAMIIQAVNNALIGCGAG